MTISCEECCKARVLYIKHRLETAAACVLSEAEYTCGAPFVPPGHILYGKWKRICLSTGETQWRLLTTPQSRASQTYAPTVEDMEQLRHKCSCRALKLCCPFVQAALAKDKTICQKPYGKGK
ncbi:UNVERIFIED_CONTAM: hypothetical protein FKN15_045251 [Acipenser sinensis]